MEGGKHRVPVEVEKEEVKEGNHQTSNKFQLILVELFVEKNLIFQFRYALL